MPRDAARLIDPELFLHHIPDDMKGPKRRLVERLADGRVARTIEDIDRRPGAIPVAGSRVGDCRVFERWTREGRTWIYRDRGYLRRGSFADAGIPRGEGEGYWRFHVNAYQMAGLADVPDDRFRALKVQPHKWRKGGGVVLVCAPSDHYARFHHLGRWTADTVLRLRQYTDRRVAVRHKDDRVPLTRALQNVHAVVTHGSVAAVEAALLGVPVFVDPSSAAAPVGLTDLAKIETPIRPPRRAWLAALAYCQFNEAEMVNGTAWSLLR